MHEGQPTDADMLWPALSKGPSITIAKRIPHCMHKAELSAHLSYSYVPYCSRRLPSSCLPNHYPAATSSPSLPSDRPPSSPCTSPFSHRTSCTSSGRPPSPSESSSPSESLCKPRSPSSRPYCPPPPQPGAGRAPHKS